MAKKPTQRELRDRRSKIMLAVLGVVLLAVLGFQLPKLMGGSGAATTPPPATTAPTGVASAALASAPTQLNHFTRFAAKDPFKPGVKASTSPGGPSTTGATTTTTPAKPKQPAITFRLSQPALVPAALIVVDGRKHVLLLGGVFPAKHPVFRLISLSGNDIWVRLIGGSFANGKRTLRLVRGHGVTLENATAGSKFVISLVKPTTAPKPAATATTTTG